MKIALHWKILMGMILGLIFGIIIININGGVNFVHEWIKPIGTIFIKLLKLIAIPLIIASLIKGIAELKDISKFSRIGGRTILIYITTTVLAVSIGLIIVNFINPGKSINKETVVQMSKAYGTHAEGKVSSAMETKDRGPLQFLEDLVPSNFFNAAADNKNMLQVIFFVIFFGISILLIKEEYAKPLKDIFNGLNEVVLKMVDLIMLMAPYAVFALIASLVAEIRDPKLFIALGWYAFAVILGLVIMVVIYNLIVFLYCKRKPSFFMKGLAPAQLLAFSTSSSAATLPVTMDRVEEHLGVDNEVASFVCPVGATINMDGTSLYQAIAAVFIAQVMNFDLSFVDQLTIIVTATLASIGSAAVPGAGMIMLVIVLESVGFPTSKLALGLALIFAIDRPLDMLRTVINVTGDATVSMIVAKSVGKLEDADKVKSREITLHQTISRHKGL